MRKNMTKEVTKTTVKIAKMEVENGLPVAVPVEDKIYLGNISMAKAQKRVKKELGEGYTVFGVEANTDVYVLPVEDFIAIAKIKGEDEEDDSEFEHDDEEDEQE